jgi:membrane fusion protein, heavy metal efflux system
MEPIVERIFGHQHRVASRCLARWVSVGSLVTLLAFCLMLTVPLSAHEGHDLAPAQESAPAASFPRVAATSELYELVGVLDGLRLTIYLDRFRDNVPVTDADINVTINDKSEMAERSPDGTYTLVSGQFGAGGLFEFVFDIHAQEGDDLLIGKVSLATVTARGAAPSDPWYFQLLTSLRHGLEDHLMLLSLFLLMGLVLGIGLRRGHSRALLILVLAAPVLTLAWSASTARGHEGHDLSEAVQAVPGTGDSARRLPDGKVFMPKRTQRILDIRTLVAKPEALPKSIVLVGRVTTNPNRSGLVQSINGGRVTAPEQGLPRLGQAVSKGDVLAMIEPPMAMADRTTISERMGELEQMIAVDEAKLKRLRSMAERQVVPQSLVIETEAELEGLYRRKELLRATSVAPEVLRAPLDGVLALSQVVVGQVVQAQDVLFQIVDPKVLWVEAYDYTGVDPAKLGKATAVASDSTMMKLAFEGWSRTLQQQATVLQFAIANPPSSIRVGEPVTVTAQQDETTTGIVIDRDAVVRGNNGETLVWRHDDPELFEARTVRTQPFDATHMLIEAGLDAGERIVNRGAEMINQIR